MFRNCRKHAAQQNGPARLTGAGKFPVRLNQRQCSYPDIKLRMCNRKNALWSKIQSVYMQSKEWSAPKLKLR